MTQKEIESLLTPEPHPAWLAFCREMRFIQCGLEPLRQAWTFYMRGYDQKRDVSENTILTLMGEITNAKAVRDDARASSQRYLEEKRQADARADIFLEDHLKYQEYLNGKPRS